MKPPKKILFLVPSLARAGAEMQVVSLVSSLDAGRFAKTLAWFEPRDDLLADVDASVATVRLQRSGRLDFALARQIAAVIDQNAIEVVHCTLLISLFYAWLARRFSRRKPRIVAAIHTTKNRDFRSDVYDWILYRWMLKDCAKVIFVCDAQREHWIARFPFLAGTASRIYNGIDAEYFSPAMSEESRRTERLVLGIAEDAIVCLCVAAMRPEKGHAILLEAMAAAREKSPKLQLYLAGDGVLRAELEKRARDLGLDPCVHFLGLVTDIRRYLRVADLTILPSTAVETFSMAMLESLATEVPVLATDIGGVREAVIEGQTGRVVTPRNIGALADALVDMSLSASELRELGRRGRTLVRQRFTRQSMVGEIGELLSAL